MVESFGVLPVRFDASLRGQVLAVLTCDNGIIENEQYQIERDIHGITQQQSDLSHSIHHHQHTQFNVNELISSLIEYDEDNELVMYNHSTQAQIAVDPFRGNSKFKNKVIRSSNVMGFVHVQEIKVDKNNKSSISKLTLLNVCQNKLPLKCLLKGHINWHDR